MGIRHRILVRAADNPSGFELVELRGPAGAGIPPHVHKAEDEAYYVVSGRARFTEEGETFEAESGSTVNLSRGKSHGWTLLDPDTVLLLTIVPGELEPMFDELAELPEGPPDLEKVAGIVGRYGIRFT